jgi:hypothetical protein
MVKMKPEEWQKVGEAIVVWSGWGRDSHPSRNDDALVERFGVEFARKILPVVRELENDFYESDARFTAADLVEMARVSAEQFMKKHPEVPDRAVRAFAWCYTFDYK